MCTHTRFVQRCLFQNHLEKLHVIKQSEIPQRNGYDISILWNTVQQFKQIKQLHKKRSLCDIE